jgi:SH3-like domain-containing protein
MLRRIRHIAMALALVLGGFSPASAAEESPDGTTGLPIPRFVSLVAAKVNMRTGPGVRYPVSWVYARVGLPMMVTGEFEHWRKVRDVDGTEGWIHKSLLSGRRMGLVVGDIHEFRVEPELGSAISFRAENGVVGRLQACSGAWCQLEVNGLSGWIARTALFGALPDEDFD